MDPRLLRYYNLELQHLHEMGAEFAQQFPKIAGRLGMNGIEVADPYVERLLEGVGFLAARVQLKIDAEFPRFTQALLEIIYPHFLAPTPSMIVARLQPDIDDPSLASGTRVVPRDTSMQSVTSSDEATACEFRTAHDVTLWPIEIVSASYFSFAPDLPLNRWASSFGKPIKGGLRIRLRATAGLKVEQLSLDRLCFYVTGRDEVANKLYELCLAAGLGVLIRSPQASPQDIELPPLPATSLRPVGFGDSQSLLPATVRTFQGYRLLQEYFSFPQRFRFVELTDLAHRIKRITGSEIELVILFDRAEPLDGLVDASNLALFCTPAINLFLKPRMDRIQVNDSAHEFHVVADRTRPLDFEIYQVTDVVGHGAGDDSEQRFFPFYSAYSSDEEHRHSAYFTTRREPRLESPEHKRRGPRSSYIGTEVFLSLVDSAQAPFDAGLRQLSIQAVCTNRDLVLQMPVGRANDFSLGVSAPVTAVRVVNGPSRPYSPLADGAVAWRAINHLSLNYLSLVNASSRDGATALRDLLELYVTTADVSAKHQIEGILSVGVKPDVYRLPPSPKRGPLAFGRGLEIVVEVDELPFEGGSAFLLGAVLDQYFARYVSINSVIETVLRSQTRGEIKRWSPHWGARPTL